MCDVHLAHVRPWVQYLTQNKEKKEIDSRRKTSRQKTVVRKEEDLVD
jgi:hypothetical protein